MTDSTGNGPQQPQQPAEIDPEQLRQFQEFQRFQEYQRFQQAQQGHSPLALPPGEVGPATQPPAVPPPIQTVYVKSEPKPMWQAILGSKLVRWLVMLLILLLLANYGYNRWFGGGDEPGDVAIDSGGSIQPENPYGIQGTVGKFYQDISQGLDVQACNRFAEGSQAAKKFAEAINEPDCQAAVRALSALVTSKSAYEFTDFLIPKVQPAGGTVEVSSCELSVLGGPRLGVFVLTKQEKGWFISDYRKITC